MNLCPDIHNNPQVKREFDQLVSAIGEPLAYYVYDKNGGNFLDKTSTGEDSQLYKDLLKYYDGDVKKAIREKSKLYNKEVTQEPSIESLNLPDKNLHANLPIENSKHPLFGMIKNKPNFKNKHPKAYPLVQIGSDGKGHYVDNIIPGSPRAIIASNFFRYTGSKNQPYYPFRYSTTTPKANQDYATYINSLFNKRVVGYDDRLDGIVFMPDVDTASLQKIEAFDADFDEYVGENLEPTNEFVDEIDTTAQDKILSRLKDRLNLLKARTAKSGGSVTSRAAINKIQSQIKEIEESITLKNSTDVLEKMALTDATIIRNNLDSIEGNVEMLSTLSNKQILDLVDTLVQNSYNIKGWIDLHEVINSSNMEEVEKTLEVQKEYSLLNKQYNNLVAKLFVEYANRTSYRTDFTKDELLADVKDSGKFRAYTESIGDSDIELLKITDDIIKKAADDISSEAMIKNNEVKDWIKKLSDAGIKESTVIELFKQKYKGNWTGNIVGNIRHEYYVTKNELLHKAMRSNSWTGYNNFVRENSIRLTNDQLAKIFKCDFKEAIALGYTQQQLEIQQQLLVDFQNDKKAFAEFLEAKYNGVQKLIEEELGLWDLHNNPNYANRNNQSVGSKYLIKEIPNEKKWADPDFAKIKNNPTLYEFYKFVQERFDENNQHIGFFNEFEENYLPETQVSLWERMKTQPSLLEKFSLLPNELKKSITNELDNQDSTNGKFKTVPINMMNANLHPSIKEDNIFKILDEHTNMSLNYKYKSEIEPMANAASDLLDSMKEDGYVDIVPNNKSKKGGQLVTAKKHLEFAKNAHLYNKRKLVEGRIKKTKTKEFATDEDGNLVLKKVDKDITASGIVDTLISYTYLKAMSFPNIVTPAVNIVYGINSNLIYASAGEDVDLKTIRKSMLQMMSITTKSFGGQTNKELTLKTFAFMQRFGLIGSIHDSSYGKEKNIGEVITILQSKAEHFNQGSLMLGILQFQKIKDKSGNDVSIFDAYKLDKGNLVWDVDKMGEQTEVGSDRIYSEDKRGVNLNRLGKYIDKINATVHGDYKTAMMAKESTVLRMMMLFKTWLPKAIDHRFGVERVDKDLLGEDGKLGRKIKGRYKSYISSTTKDGVDVLFKDTIKMMLKGIVSKKAFNQLSAVDRINMIRNIKELQQIGILLTAAAILKGITLDDDDDKNIKPVLNLAINMLSKSGNDLSFFLSASSSSQIFENIVPIASSVKDMQKAVSSLFTIFTGEVMYQNGPWKGYPKPLIAVGRTIPGSSGAIRMWNLASKAVDY